jgi:hypothetical protein
MTFKENDIVRDESHIAALLTAGAILAKLEDEGARMCANAKCQCRFDLSESSPIDFPIMEAIKRDEIVFNGVSLWLNPGKEITDRSLCLYLSSEAMKERVKHSLREISSETYICCPKCKHVSKRNADLQSAKN